MTTSTEVSGDSNTLSESNWRRRLKLVAGVSIVVHLAAGLTMAFVLRHGLAANWDLASRLSFLASERISWIAAWIPWNIAAFCILLLCICFRFSFRSLAGNLLTAAAVVCALGVCFDLTAQVLAMAVLPDLAQLARQDAGQLKRFQQLYSLIVISSGAAGNGAYSLATLICAWAARAHFPKWVTVSAYVVCALGLAATISCLIDSVILQVTLNAALLPLICLWLWGVALHSTDAAESS